LYQNFDYGWNEGRMFAGGWGRKQAALEIVHQIKFKWEKKRE
jgi:hypothetical protein